MARTALTLMLNAPKLDNPKLNQVNAKHGVLPKLRRHPNLLTAAERAQLPDPCRPIDSLIIPAVIDPIAPVIPSGSLSEPSATPLSNNSANARLAGEIPAAYQFMTFKDFITAEQRFRSQHPLAPPLHLPFLNKLIAESGVELIEQVLTSHPSIYTQPLQAKLALMTQLYPTLLCVFLLSQCKARKTLNPSLNFVKISQAINHYIVKHQQTLKQLTPAYPLLIEPYHVQFAVLALGWPISQHPEMAERITTLSSQNFLLKSP